MPIGSGIFLSSSGIHGNTKENGTAPVFQSSHGCPKKNASLIKEKVFYASGRWIPNKGIRILIEAYRLSSPNPSEWPLTMLGDGPLKAEVEERIRQMGIQGIHMPAL